MTQILESITFAVLLMLIIFVADPISIDTVKSTDNGQLERISGFTVRSQNETYSENTTQSGTNLTVITTVVNNCQPKTTCDWIRADDFQIGIYEFQDSKPNPLNLIKSFPGSAQGWLVSFIAPFTQYDVNTNTGIADYSPGCHGILSATQNKTCVISLNVTDPVLRNRLDSDLTVITTVVNNCQPKTRCDWIRADEFQIGIYEFQDSKPNPLNLIKSFPGSAQGWTITSLLPSQQYDIKQWYPVDAGNMGVNVSYSPGCHGSVDLGRNECMIRSELTTIIDANNTSQTSINRQ